MQCVYYLSRSLRIERPLLWAFRDVEERGMDNESRYMVSVYYEVSLDNVLRLIVMPLAPSNPLTPADLWTSSLTVLVERAFEPAGSKTLFKFDTVIDIYMMDPIFMAHEIVLGSKSLERLSHVFTAEYNVEGAAFGALVMLA
jgi:hypothetical protein